MDIVVGIPAYNCAHTINYVIYQTAKGLTDCFPDREAVIIVSDGGSSDGTLAVVNALKMQQDITIVSTQYTGISGKGTALKAIFEAMVQLDAQAVTVIDSDLRSIRPEWVRLLLSAPLKGTGLVTPLYSRHKYDGTITNFLCYPFTQALYSKGIRQPIGGDFGLSRKLVERLLESILWNTSYVPRFGIDIFETHTALGENFDVKQAFLGSKVHEAKNPANQLTSMFHEVAGAMFACTKKYEDVWNKIRPSQSVDVIEDTVSTIAPEEIHVDVKKLFQEFKARFQLSRHICKQVLNPQLFHHVTSLAMKNESHFAFPSEYWARCVYSFAAAFKRETDAGERNLLEALRVLWLGKVASFVLETLDAATDEAEEKIETEAAVFEELKPYLLEMYESGD